MAKPRTRVNELTEGDPPTRAVAAAVQLARAGGFDAVQIRDIVRLTGLSTATIYRYFSSKEHLIAVAHVEWVRGVRAGRRPLPDGPPEERLAAFLHRTCEGLRKAPELGKAFALALGASDPGVRACRIEADRLIAEMIADAIGDADVDVEEFVADFGLAWQGGLFSWAHGHFTLAELDRRLVRCARLLLAGSLRS